MDNIRIGKSLSYYLRHKPEELNLTIDNHGWVNVDELICKMNDKRFGLNLEQLKQIVKTNNKQRFSFNDDMTKIRANQGHTIKFDLDIKSTKPLQYLYHGTPKENLSSILYTGISKKARHHVHLSEDIETARKVGERRGDAIIFRIDTERMYNEGIVFYKTENNVWLVDEVPTQYIIDHI